LALVVIACGDSSGPTGPKAASVTGIAGDSQVAPTGVALDFPLTMTLLGSNGQPVQGVSVTWSAVPANGALFSPQPSVSDVNGVVTTNVTMGSVEDTIVINATVPGVAQPVVFHELAVNPCAFARVHTLGQTVNGALTTIDCKLGTQFKYYYDFYALSLASQTGVTINMSANYDTWIDFYRDIGAQLEYLGYHDDIAPPANLNSRFQAILPAGVYIIGANTADTLVTGPYTLTSAVRPQTITSCQELWVTRGVVINDNISSTDCADTTGVGSYGDSVKMIVVPGSVLKIAARSSAVNPRLALGQVIFRAGPDSLALLAFNDDSAAGNQNAYIAYSVPAGNQLLQLVIFAGTTGTGQTGAYTLDISSATTLSATASGRAWRGGADQRPRVALPTDPFHLLKRSKR
jgi:hypothetical protein